MSILASIEYFVQLHFGDFFSSIEAFYLKMTFSLCLALLVHFFVTLTHFVRFDQELQTKKYLMVGSGCPSIFDNGFTLMRNYGVPYIPASAFKGAFSHYVAQELESDNPIKKNYKFLFGTGDNDDNIRGNLIFLDVIPKSYSLGIDIINNHFQPYYSDEKNEKAPNDYYDPVPVQYLVIDRGSIFRFTVLDNGNIGDDLKQELEKSLMDFLGDFGLGAKTSYGYGLFKKPK